MHLIVNRAHNESPADSAKTNFNEYVMKCSVIYRERERERERERQLLILIFMFNSYFSQDFS